MNYIQKTIDILDKKLQMPKGYEALLGYYALLVHIVGDTCTKKHIHDAWSVWQNTIDPTHRSLIPFDELTKEVQDLDEEYCVAVIETYEELNKN